MVAYGTAGTNDPDIPIEDSLFYELDETSLFEANAASGYVTYEGGSKASLGTSITARWKNGMSISALGGPISAIRFELKRACGSMMMI